MVNPNWRSCDPDDHVVLENTVMFRRDEDAKKTTQEPSVFALLTCVCLRLSAHLCVYLSVWVCKEALHPAEAKTLKTPAKPF